MIKDVHFKNPTPLICAELFTNTKLRRWLKRSHFLCAPKSRPNLSVIPRLYGRARTTAFPPRLLVHKSRSDLQLAGRHSTPGAEQGLQPSMLARRAAQA